MILDTLRARHLFLQLASLEEAVFPLDRAALTIALEEYPNLDIQHYLSHLDTLAARVEVLAGDDRSPINVLQSINDVLFVQEGLRGNNDDYYDPRNSFLNDVLDNKNGIPISLSVIYLEVARRINFNIHGVAFPSHFIVKYSSAGQEILIDPFNLGKFLTADDCQELLDRVYGGSVELRPTFLQAMSKKAIVSRMLYNLKGIYYQREENQKALAIVERILMLNPGTLSEIRDRGLLFMQTSLFARALADLEFYLANSPAPEDRSYVEGHIRTLRGIIGCSN